MPQRRMFRTWCVTCQDWELFETHVEDEPNSEPKCDRCGSPRQAVKLGEIPPEKIAEQRKRFKHKRSQIFQMSLATLLSGGGGFDHGYHVTESDAGLEAQEKAEKELREQKKREKAEFNAQYDGLGRNEPCRCGSGRKYKKCCLAKVQEK